MTPLWSREGYHRFECGAGHVDIAKRLELRRNRSFILCIMAVNGWISDGLASGGSHYWTGAPRSIQVAISFDVDLEYAYRQ